MRTQFIKTNLFAWATLLLCMSSYGQNSTSKPNEANIPMYLLPPDYPVPYGPPKAEEVISSVNKVYTYLDGVTPYRFINRVTKDEIKDLSKPDTNAIIERGTFGLHGYEWGVTYSAMLLLSKATDDVKYRDYTQKRMDFLNTAFAYYKQQWDKGNKNRNPFRRIFESKALDDCGSMSAAFIKAQLANPQKNYRSFIDLGVDFVMNKEHRLADKTLARMRPHANTLWLDDMYMGIPVLAYMGALTGESKYYDEAAFQILSYADKMFVKETNLFRHGWVEAMTDHPSYHWGRANGWVILTLCDVLDILPENHKDRAKILEIYRTFMKGIAKYQGDNGLWHQVIDDKDTYYETSASAMFTYCLAHGINKGWLDAAAYGPQAILGWNAVSTKINAQGQVEGTCVGTGMGFDPAFYAYRPVRALAAHGYGPVLLAGAETLMLLKNFQVVINESSVMFYKQGVDWKNLQIK
jgi:rhamnogalacturonyl hydrolase YesR